MRLLHAVALLLFVCAVPVQAGDEDLWNKKLPFESATIEYAIDGMEKGTETLYIKDYGQHTAKHHSAVMSMMGMKVESRTLEITDPDWIYHYDLKEGTGTKSTNPVKYMKAEYDKLTDAEKKQVNKNAEKMAVNFQQGGGGSIEKNVAEMFGFKVDRATVMGIESYTIHDTPITLRTSGTIMGMTIDTKATSFNKGTVDDKFFQHPANIQAVHDPRSDAMMQTMAEKTMAWLKDPEAETKAPPVPSASDMFGNQGQGQPQGNSQQLPGGLDKSTEKVMEGVLKGLFGN